MTQITGVNLLVAPCCGARYKSPRYTFLNYSASAYWTDGWRENSLMPNDGGLRRCRCGKYVLVREMAYLGHSESSDWPWTEAAKADDLRHCLQQKCSLAFEAVVRRLYWQHLNHAYRDIYIAFRKDVVAQDDAAGTFTCPPFRPNVEQCLNMTRLAELLNDMRLEGSVIDTLLLSELYRELGHFDQAGKVLDDLRPIDRGTTSKVLEEMIEQRKAAPIRYRM